VNDGAYGAEPCRAGTMTNLNLFARSHQTRKARSVKPHGAGVLRAPKEACLSLCLAARITVVLCRVVMGQRSRRAVTHARRRPGPIDAMLAPSLYTCSSWSRSCGRDRFLCASLFLSVSSPARWCSCKSDYAIRRCRYVPPAAETESFKSPSGHFS
jgi:hypothetical protein